MMAHQVKLASGTVLNGGPEIGFRDGTGKLELLELGYNGGGAPISSIFKFITAAGGVNTTAYQIVAPSSQQNNPIFVKLIDDGTTTISFSISGDYGNHWWLTYSEGRTSFFASGPTQFFFGARTDAQSVDVALLSMK